jgi:hypothetical protein
MVSVETPTRADKNRLTALGLDMSEHGGAKAIGVLLHDDDDRETLRKNGFRWNTVQAAPATSAAAVALPSGRTSYRRLADYESELKALAAANPTLVRLFVLPNKTFEGREVLGIEISENVTANDGKPSFLNMGVHHAREWPAGELTMEWAYELVNGYKAGEERATNIVRRSRNLVVPIVNPDGFNGSRSAATGDDGRDETVDDTVYIAGAPGEYRRKNCRVGDTETAFCPVSVGLAENGVDPNRNYGQFWGGPGSDTNPATQTYRGAAPFSEPESRNIQWLVSHNQVTTLITNHTTAGLVLRAPGLAAVGDPIDENRGYKQLGDDMAKQNGYFSQKGFELYDTTGTTEDWSYNATGGYGFTFELYCGSPNYATGDCDAPAFHPRYATMAKEWDGTSAQADHVNDPGANHGFDGKGNREAYYIAAESTIDEARHSIIEGSAPAGTTLRLTKDFKTETFPQNGTPLQVSDHLETTYAVGASGTFLWHVNPSTRPVVAKESGSPNPGAPSAPQTASGTTAATPPNSSKDHAFTVPDGGDNASAAFRVEWTTPVSDWDIELFRDTNGNGIVDSGEPSIGTSAQAATDFEEVTAPNPTGSYVLRVTNYAAAENYTVTVTYAAPAPYKAAQVESYTLTCERGGAVLATQQVVVDRGATAQVAPCPAAGAGSGAPGAKAPGTTALGGKTTVAAGACAATSGFKSVGVKPSAKGLGIELAPTAPATVSIFRQSSGRRITGEQLVARFKDRTKAFAFNTAVADGYYFVRFTNGKDTRRVTLRRSGGRYTRVGDFYRRASCDLVPSYKLSRPVFGGTVDRNLGISYRTARAAQVTVTVLRGSRIVKRFPLRKAAANRAVRLRLPAKGLARGDYTVRLVARAGSEVVSSKLVSRRL